MGHGDDRTLVLLQVLFEPVDAFGVEVVGRFVEQEHIGLLKQQTAQCHTTALTAREVLDRPVGRRTAEGIHGTLELTVHVPCVGRVDDVLNLGLTSHELLHAVGVFVVFGQCKLGVYLVVFAQCIIHPLHTFHHVFLHRLGGVELWVLRQVAHRVARTPHYIALILLVDTGNDFHECGLTCSVEAYDTYLGSVEEREVYVFEYLLLVLLYGLRYSHHREYHFLVVNCWHGENNNE